VASIAVALSVFAGGCGDGEASPADAGADAGGDGTIAGLEIVAPAEPAAPVLGPCPTGWSEIELGGVDVCTPYPATGAPAACEDGFVHLPGDPGCVRFGSECPADGVPAGLPKVVSVLFVRAGASGGDGSAARPFGSIGEALGVAAAGAVVAIAPGTYDEALRLERPVTLWGACPAGVVLTSSATSAALDSGVVTVESSGVTLRNLAIAGAARAGVWATVAGARVEVLDVIIEEVTVIGIAVEQGAQLVADGLIVRGTRPGPGGQFGRGLGAETGGRVEVRRALFERNHEFGVMVMHETTSVALESALVRDGLVREANGRDGIGVAVMRGSSARVARSWLSGNRAGAASAIDPGSHLELDQVWAVDTRAQPDGLFGRGINVEQGATLIARRVVATGNREAAAFAQDSGTTLQVSDSILARSLPRETDGQGGRGASIQLGAAATFERVLVDESLETGIAVTGAGAWLDMEDIVIRRTTAGVDGIGRGLAVEGGATTMARRVLIETSAGVGALAQMTGTSIEMEDTRIRGTSPLGGFIPARALGVQRQANGRFTRLALEDNAQFGMIALEEGTHVELTEISVTETRENDCPSCVRGGTALSAFDGAAVSAARFVVRGADLCGAHVGASSEIDLSTGDIVECLLGACVQSESYDLTRLGDDVRYRDNGTNLGTTTLPVPDAVPELPAE
jgi:hypothetical protein